MRLELRPTLRALTPREMGAEEIAYAELEEQCASCPVLEVDRRDYCGIGICAKEFN